MESAGDERKSNGVVSAAARYALLGLILLATFAAFAQTLRFQFVYDDEEQIVNNALLRSWRFTPQFFTHPVWYYLHPGQPGNYYRPVFLLWLRLNYALFGLTPLGWHLAAVLIHVVVTGMVYWLAFRLLADRVTAGLAALLFGLHPVHIEAVAWISGTTEPLLAVLFIPAFVFHLNQRERPENSVWWRAASLAAYACALLAKETAAVLPLLILAYEYLKPSSASQRVWFAGRWRKVLHEMMPYLGITLLYFVVRLAVFHRLGYVMGVLSTKTMLLTWPSLVLFYLRLLVFPLGLSAFYDIAYVMSPNLSTFVLPAIGLGSIGAILWIWWRRSNSQVVALSSLWLIVPLLPVLNLKIFMKGECAHDRYLYLPSVGFCILMALAVRQIRLESLTVLHQPAIHVSSAFVLAGLLAAGTVTQSVYWENNLFLYRRGVAIAPENLIAQNNLAREMYNLGLEDDATQRLRAILARDPDFWAAYANLGYINYRLGKFADANQYLTRAIEIYPRDSRLFYLAGLTRFKMNQIPESERALRQAIQMQPQHLGYHLALGRVLKAQSRFAEALEEFRGELVNDPKNETARREVHGVGALQRR